MISKEANLEFTLSVYSWYTLQTSDYDMRKVSCQPGKDTRSEIDDFYQVNMQQCR